MFYLTVTAEDKPMSTGNNNDYHYTEREKRLLELYKNARALATLQKN
ncbi:MAG TPA: hypothetical protein VI278_07340 [Nitrososphaeraceae archaeon]